MPVVKRAADICAVDTLMSGADDRQRVLKLEAIRQEHGYKAGWLFYKCKDAGLLDTYNSLHDEGLIASEDRAKTPQIADKPLQLLTIELVPEMCWFSNVRSEVSEEDWNRLKKTTFQKAENRCQICGGRGAGWPVECHELWHYDDKNHKQTLTGLMALCPACHEVKHMGFARTQGRAEIAAQHLAKTNDWSTQETDQYIAAQFSIWKRRSKHEWQLDISWLEQFGITASDTR